jgi:predicted lysophospholipase L1 biosynthesis ABC-type transport system permease subunit
MANEQESLQTLAEIRDLMARSSKFLSLSGLSGVAAGVAALVGACVANVHINETVLSYGSTIGAATIRETLRFLILDGMCVLAAALIMGVFFTVRKAQKQGYAIWNNTSKRLLMSLMIPLVTGGLFCVAMVFKYHILWIVFPATLIFYGLALLNGSRYTHRDVEYLGISEIVIGLLALFFPNNNLLMWALGFGVMHIIYGTFMYFKYDKK